MKTRLYLALALATGFVGCEKPQTAPEPTATPAPSATQTATPVAVSTPSVNAAVAAAPASATAAPLMASNDSHGTELVPRERPLYANGKPPRRAALTQKKP